MSETCRLCEVAESGDRKVKRSENIPLCNRHWSQWVARYAWPSELEAPCSAHVIEEAP